MFPQRPSLPDTPPPLSERVEVSAQQLKRASTVLADLSSAIGGLPVVLSQDGDVVTCAGEVQEVVFDRMARISGRTWQEGASRSARELVRFEEEVIGEDDSRVTMLLYSAHIQGAVTLSIGWQLSISLTQLRAEVKDVRDALRNLLAG
ncbi:MAG: hypothetical protein IT326_08650 [Anaerolineae bacterium]|nr:hypothetical protein [Anaerolineae bacterium]